jgi:hypothetical protein
VNTSQYHGTRQVRDRVSKSLLFRRLTLTKAYWEVNVHLLSIGTGWLLCNIFTSNTPCLVYKIFCEGSQDSYSQEYKIVSAAWEICSMILPKRYVAVSR